ncbi:MAG: Maf family protein [Holosporales bacterium]
MIAVYCPQDALYQDRLEILKSLGMEPSFHHLTLAEMSAKHTALYNIKNVCADLAAGGDGLLLFSVVAVGRRVLRVPHDQETAGRYLRLISGRRHRVYTVLLWTQGEKKSLKIAQTWVRVKPLTSQEIEHFIVSDDWRNRPGAYLGSLAFMAHVQEIGGHPCWNLGVPLYELQQVAKTFRAV